jgi:hypothetical protein
MTGGFSESILGGIFDTTRSNMMIPVETGVIWWFFLFERILGLCFDFGI